MKIKWFCILSFWTLAYFLTSFNKTETVLRDDDKFVVVLDAGHGGHDPGNLGNGYLEKNIALNIVLGVGEILEKNPNIKVIYTRKDDTFVDLYKRGEIANKADADLFVSVHCDSHSSDAHGAGTFVLGLHANKQNFEIAKKENSVIYLEDNYETRYAAYDINSPESIIGLTIMQEEFLDQSILLAKMMQDNFTGKLNRNDRKVKQAGFIVLHQTFMPSILVETGFLTNKEEGAYLNSKKGQSEMAAAIAEAILKYKGDLVAENSTTSNEPITNASAPVTELPVSQNPIPEKIAETSPPPVVVKEEVKPLPKDETKQSIAIENKESIPVEANENERKSKANLVFKVQLMASSKDISLNAENFMGLSTLTKEPFNNLYRYMYGNAPTYFDAKLLKSNADAKGYTASYIVAYKDGARIPLEAALKYVSQ